MEPIKVTLCPACGDVRRWRSRSQGVSIGEDENTVKLTREQWNDLLARMRRGELAAF